MEIGSYWYQQGTNNKRTYHLTYHYHLIVDLETIIPFAIMTYIAELEGYELHLGDERVFKNFVDES